MWNVTPEAPVSFSGRRDLDFQTTAHAELDARPCQGSGPGHDRALTPSPVGLEFWSMAKQIRFTLCFAPEAVEHLDFIESKYHGLLRRTIREQLRHTPTEETRNRKPLEPPAPFEASWELRCGPNNRFRVFYDVDSARLVVDVLAIGVKDRERLLIRGEEYEL